MKPLLEVNHLTVTYRSNNQIIRAVNDLSFSLERGKTFGLVGETGAGKTTTALSILRLLPASVSNIVDGSICYYGEELLSIPEKEMNHIRGQRISMIFQDPMAALNPTMTVGSQIAEAVALHNKEKRQENLVAERVCEVLEMVGIPAERRFDYPHQFSGGMKQRVVIAIALACEPELIIADEPTTALDVTIQAQVLELLNDLKKRLGTSMILITHDLGVIAKMCDTVGVMYAGEIVECGTMYDIFSPGVHHPYTTGLINSIPNLQSDAARLTPIKGLPPDPANLPKGCKFYPRCSIAAECCKNPPTYYTDGSHKILCDRCKENQS